MKVLNNQKNEKSTARVLGKCSGFKKKRRKRAKKKITSPDVLLN